MDRQTRNAATVLIDQKLFFVITVLQFLILSENILNESEIVRLCEKYIFYFAGVDRGLRH